MSAAPPTGTVTFLFTDIEGSTERWERQRAAMEAALARHNAILTGAIEERGGYVFKTVGDAFCASFAHASDAIEAAIEAQRLLHGERFQLAGDEPLLVRMGIHTGLVELKDSDYFGRPVNRVARLMSAGHGGQVLVSLATQQLVRDALPEGASLTDLGVHRLKDLEHTEHIYRLQAPGMPEVDTPPDTAERLGTGQRGALEGVLEDAECPYRGLHAFREEDARFFFGREVFTTRLVDALTHKPMVGVIGPSGSGKSSVVYAGMLPELRALNGETSANGWTVLKLRPGAEPFAAIAGALVPLLEPDMSRTARMVETARLADALADGTLSVAKVVANLRQERGDLGSLLFIADQFEELYTLCPDVSVQRAFQDLLFEAVHEPNGSGPVRLALTLRADFMGHATAYRPFSDAMQDHNVILGPMNRDELMRTIVKPAELQGRAFEAGLVERIADDVGEEAGALPLLEFALTKLWEKQEAGWLTHEAYESIGRVEGAVARHADAVYDGLSEPDQELTRKVFVQMVRPGEGTEDTRRVAKKDELGDEGWSLVRKLADARLIVTNRDESGRETAEVVHEALIRTWGRLTEWMGEDRQFRMWQERLRFAIRQWEDADRDEGALLRGVPLAEANEWARTRPNELNASERDFIELAHAEEQLTRRRRHKLQRRVRNSLAAVAVVSILGLAVALGLATTADRARTRAESIALASKSQTMLAKNLRDGALAMAIEALAVSGTEIPQEVELALFEAAYTPGSQIRATGHLSNVNAVAITPDGKRLISGANDGLREWDLSTGGEEGSWDVCDGAVYDLDISVDGHVVLAGCGDGTVRLWDIASADVIQTLRAHENLVKTVRLAPDMRRAISISGDLLVLWDVESAEPLWTADGIPWSQEWHGAEFHPDGERLVLASSGSGLRTIDLRTGAVIEEFGGRMNCVAVSPDGRHAVTGGSDSMVRLWDLETGEQLHSFGGHSNQLHDVAYSPNGRLVASGGIDTAIRVWDTVTGAEVGRLVGHDARVAKLAFGPNGRRLASASFDRTARVWLIDSPAMRHRLDGHEGRVVDVSLDDSGSLIASGSADGSVRLWDMESGTQVGLIWTGSPVDRVALRPDGRQVAVGQQNGDLEVWDTHTGLLAGVVAKLRVNVADLAWSSDGSFLLSATDKLRLWDVASGLEIHRLPAAETFYFRSVALEPSGRIAMAGGNDNVFVWDLESGAVRHRMSGFHGDTPVNWVAIGPEAHIGASGGGRKVALWDLESGEQLHFEEFDGEVRGISFRPDGKYLAVGTQAGAIEILDVRERFVVRRYSGVHTARMHQVLYSPDGRHLVSGASDNTARVWTAHRDLGGLTRWLKTWPDLPSFTCDERARDGLLRPCREGLPGADSYEVVADLAAESGAEEEGEGTPTSRREAVAVNSESTAVVEAEARVAPILDALRNEPASIEDHGVIEAGSHMSELNVNALGIYSLRASSNSIIELNLDAEPSLLTVPSAPEATRPPQTRLQLRLQDPADQVVLEQMEIIDGRDTQIEVDPLVLTEEGVYEIDVRRIDVSGTLKMTLPVTLSVQIPNVRGVAPLASLGRQPDPPIYGMALAPHGRTVASGQADGSITTWDLGTSEALGQLGSNGTGHTDRVLALAYSPNGRRLLSSATGEIILWDVERGEEIRRLEGHAEDQEIYGLAFHPDGRRAISGSLDRTAIIWDVETGAVLHRLEGHSNYVSRVLLNRDGTRAYTSSHDKTIGVWDVETGSNLGNQAGQEKMNTMALSPDGSKLYAAEALAGDRSAVAEFDVASGELERRFRGHTAALVSVATSPDGRWVLSGGVDVSPRLWDVASGTEIARLIGHEGEIRNVAFTPDGQRAITNSLDGTVRIWDLSEVIAEHEASAGETDGDDSVEPAPATP